MAEAGADMTPYFIDEVGLNRRAPGPPHLPNDRFRAPDCTLTGYRMHRVAHPKPTNRYKKPRFRPMFDCAIIFGVWEESSGNSQINDVQITLGGPPVYDFWIGMLFGLAKVSINS